MVFRKEKRHVPGEARPGDFVLLSKEKASLPRRGEAGAADLCEILGEDCDVLQPYTLLKSPEPSASDTSAKKARARALHGHWPKIAKFMGESGICSFRPLGLVLENSVFGMLKKIDRPGLQ